MDSNDLNTMWTDVRERVKNYESVDPTQINAFFPRLQPQAMSEGYLMLTADTEFIKTWIERHYIDIIKKALLDIYHVSFTVAIEVDPAGSVPAPRTDTMPAASVTPNQRTEDEAPLLEHNYRQTHSFETKGSEYGEWEDPSFDVPPYQSGRGFPYGGDPRNLKDILNDENTFESEYTRDVAPDFDGPTSHLTFENFVIGDSNRMAYSMAVAVAEMPGKSHLNPLFIYGKSGLGKTHLMRAIQNYVRETMPRMSVIYVDSAELLSDYMEASAAHDKEKSSYKNFKTRYEEADVLLIDDVQYLQGKKQTLDIVFQIFNKITSQGKQVVLSADRAPKNIDIDERYKSRFNSGGTFDIQPPDIETKLGIVKSFIAEYRESEEDPNFAIPEEIQMYIAENSSSNIRELKSAVTKVICQMPFFSQSEPSLEEVRGLLENHFSGGSSKRLTIADVQREVEAFFKVSHADLVGKKRTRNIVYARHIAIYLSRQLTDMPLEAIGKKFNRDHTTALYSVTSIEDKMKKSRELCEELNTLQQIIRDI